MANTGGPLPVRRRLLMEVANSNFGSEIWAETLQVKKRSSSLVSVQRTAALHTASAYRTVFAPVVLVKASTIPVDLLAASEIGWKLNSRSLQAKHRYKMATTMER